MPTLILDFDQTLFDVVEFKKALFQANKSFLIKKTPIFWESQAKKVVKEQGHYSYKRHLKISVPVRYYKRSVLAYEKILKNCRKFLYADALPFIRRHQNSFSLVILSTGHKSFQKVKIKNCGLDKYVDYLITLDPKHKSFPKIFKNYQAPFYFFEDKGKEIDPVKQKYPQVICYWMRRPDGEYKNEPCRKYDYKINNLKLNLKSYE